MSAIVCLLSLLAPGVACIFTCETYNRLHRVRLQSCVPSLATMFQARSSRLCKIWSRRLIHVLAKGYTSCCVCLLCLSHPVFIPVDGLTECDRYTARRTRGRDYQCSLDTRPSGQQRQTSPREGTNNAYAICAAIIDIIPRFASIAIPHTC